MTADLKKIIPDSVLSMSQSSSLGGRLHIVNDCMSSCPLASPVPPSATENYFEDVIFNE
jgi:hypothetical protein